jgi:hypothetical protein
MQTGVDLAAYLDSQPIDVEILSDEPDGQELISGMVGSDHELPHDAAVEGEGKAAP